MGKLVSHELPTRPRVELGKNELERIKHLATIMVCSAAVAQVWAELNPDKLSAELQKILRAHNEIAATLRPPRSGLDEAWAAVNALAGAGADEREEGFNDGICAALVAIEKLGGRDTVGGGR